MLPHKGKNEHNYSCEQLNYNLIDLGASIRVLNIYYTLLRLELYDG